MTSHRTCLCSSFVSPMQSSSISPAVHSCSPESIEPLVGVADEGQTHLRHVFLTQRVDLRAIGCRMIYLVDFIGWEVGDVDVGVEAGFERRADLAEAVPGDAAEEFMAFNFRCAG